MNGVKVRWVVAYCIVIAALAGYSPDPLYFSFACVLGLTSIKLVFQQPERLKNEMSVKIVLPVLFSALGLLVLIKVSFLAIAMGAMVVSATVMLIKRFYALTAAIIVLPILSFVSLWVVSGASLEGLSYYFTSSHQIMSGYSYAMMWVAPGPIWTMVMYIISAVLICRIIYKDSEKSVLERSAIILLLAMFLFISFKEAYVRQDGHELNAMTALVVGLFLSPFITQRRSIISSFFIVLTSLIILHYYVGGGPSKAITAALSNYEKPWQALNKTVQQPNWLQQEYVESLKKVRAQFPLPKVVGSTDIYPFDQAYLFASHAVWAPRPVLQSYSAYTPALAELDKEYLLGPSAPKNIFFAVKPIDNRVPTSPDGASWPVLLNSYQLKGLTHGFAFLQRKVSFDKDEGSLSVLLKRHAHLGEAVKVPVSSKLVYVKLDVEPTWFGRLVALFFRARRLDVLFHFADGSSQEYNFIPSMAKTGYLISPLINNTKQFAMLYRKNLDSLKSLKVKSFVIAPKIKLGVFWQKSYAITFLVPA
ncbi:MAG: hypothetical protein P1U63_03345 [Coxiellaceae bacterium]|nr:hypothetical protein [Coxiellaceae bacterium]